MKRLRNVFPAGLFSAACALAAYAVTGSRSIGYWDSAELATAGATLGIAHPTGYPLFTLAERAFGILPTGLSFYHNLNLFGALCSAAAVFLLHRMFLSLLSEVRMRSLFRFSGSAGSGTSTVVQGVEHLAAGTAALMLAFSRVFWSEGVSLEVYALHLVFFSGVTLLFLRSLAESGSPFPSRRWLLFAYLLGLSFSHHMMTVLLGPAFLYLYLAAFGTGRKAWTRIVHLTPAFLLGLTPYLYLPVRASANPVVNWGDPSSLANFWAHVSAAQYRFKMFASPEIAGGKFTAFFRDLPGDFAWVALPFTALGLWILVRKGPRLAVFTCLLVATCLAYAVNYDFDDPNFRLHAHAMIALWAAFGLRAALARVPGKATRLAACALLVLVPFDSNYRALDRSADHAVEDYSRAVLASAEPGALILSGDLEGFVLGARYLQLAEGVRPDIAVVGLGALAYPWYHGELEAAHPGLLDGMESEIAAYLSERSRIERGATPDVSYNLAYTRLVRALLRESSARRPIYAAFVPPEFFREYRAFPQGLLLRLSRDAALPALPPPTLPVRPVPTELPYASKVAAGYASGFLNHAFYHLGRGENAEAERLLRAALDLDPKNMRARELLGLAQSPGR